MNIADRQSILDQIVLACQGAQTANRDAYWASVTLRKLCEEMTMDIAAVRVAAGLVRESADKAKACADTACALFGQIPEQSGTEAGFSLTSRSYDWKCCALSESERAATFAHAASIHLAQSERGVDPRPSGVPHCGA